MHESVNRSGHSPERQVPGEKDIGPVLHGWAYEPGTISVRKVVGTDGLPKVQLRLDLGLLQMEMTGRPDGGKPHGCESLLDYYERRLRSHIGRQGNEMGFGLAPADCQGLRDESLMYYHRYLSLFVLGEYPGVARDTEHNLRVLDLCSKFAADETDRMALEQYRPYILMMNARARASIQLHRHEYRKALKIVRRTLRRIREFFLQFGQARAYRRSGEVRVLKQLRNEISQHVPPDPVLALKKQLRRAIHEERYEEAARLRDELTRLSGSAS
jgi:hypothetical protein